MLRDKVDLWNLIPKDRPGQLFYRVEDWMLDEIKKITRGKGHLTDSYWLSEKCELYNSPYDRFSTGHLHKGYKRWRLNATDYTIQKTGYLIFIYALQLVASVFLKPG